jgi:hypothetical protein
MRFLMIPCYLGLLFLSQTLSAKSNLTPPEITLSNLVHVSCFGLNDGAISVSVSNGKPPYSFNWSNGETTQDIANLAAGTYSCTVTDLEGMQGFLTGIIVTEPAVLTAFVDSVHNVDCTYNTGFIGVKATGGTLPFTYAWSNGWTEATNGLLPVDDYTITVTDAHGCTSVTNGSVIKDTAPPMANAGPDVNILCSNSMTTLSGSGSTGPDYQYLWTASNGGMIQSGGTTLNPTVSRIGTYTLKVTSLLNGCTTTDAAIVTSTYVAPSATATGGIITCAQPTVTLNASFTTLNTKFNGWGGPGGYFSALQSPTISATGAYYFSVTDTITTCSTQATTVVTSDLLKPTAMATGGGTLTCIVTSLTLQGSGTPLNISFAWSGPGGYSSAQQNPVVTSSGVYTLTVTNPSNGCTATASQSVLSNTTAPSSTVTVSNVITCLAPAAIINCNTNPAGCTFNWSGPGNYTSTLQNPTVLNPGVYTAIIRNPANGCSSTASATVLANNTGPVVTTTGGALSCAITSTMISASSNVTNATYTWIGPNFFSNVRNPTVTLTGTYTVTVTNPSNGCSTSATAFVSLNATQPNVSATGTLVNCNTPSPKIIASSTTPGATFVWSGPNGFSSTIPNPTVTAGGTYTVTATNPTNGCTRSTSVFVTEDLTPPFVYAGDDRSLNCYFTSIVTNPIGIPTGPNYSYLWTTFDGNIVSGATTINARLDLAGTYTFTVKNSANGCSARDSMVLRQSPPVTAKITLQSPISCNGGSNAVLKVTPGGGNENYTYSWSTGATTATISNVGAGTYTVAVMDGEGCSVTGSINVTQPAVVQAVVNTTPQTMQGANNGSATVIPSGGTPGYTVKWNNNSTLLIISNLAPGNYTVTVTDSKGCTFAKTGTVNAVNCTITGSITPTNLNCAGVNSGAATLTVSGAANPTTFLWSTGATTSSISNLPIGNYSVTATDAQGCPLVLSTQISSPQPLNLAVSNQTDVACNNMQTGAATLSVSGGTAPFTYKWTNNQTSATATNLGLGTFTCTVTDSKGCTLSKSITIVATDHNAPQLSLKNASVTLNSNGTATVTPAMFDQGSTDLECSIVSWTVNPTTFDCAQIGTRTVTITATDLNGNTATGTATVQVSDNIAPTLVCPDNKSATGCAPVVTFDVPQIQDNCSATGTPVITTGLPSGSSFPVGVTNQMFTYTDAGGNSTTCTFTVTVTPSLSLTASGTPTTCPGACNGTATATLSGGAAPFSYLWSVGQNTATATALCPGDYTVTATDAAGCSQTQTVSISSGNTSSISITTIAIPAGCSAACDGTIQLGISGGNNPINVSWSNGANGAAINGLCPGQYTATLTDASGCSDTHSVEITIHDTEIPVLVCPNNIVSGYCNATVIFNQPLISDNCPTDLQALQLVSGLPSGAVFPAGVTNELFRYTDAGGNTGQCAFTVTISEAPVITQNATPLTCNGVCNGTASVNISGGHGPFSVLWNNGTFANEITNLCPGNYTNYVTDADGCVQIHSSTITQPPALSIVTDQVTQDDGSGIGGIDISVSGGVQPYTYAWNKNGQFLASTEDLSGLSGGQYQTTITDANGCLSSGNIIILNTVVASSEAAPEQAWSLYPNPATAVVYLETAENNTGTAQLSIFESTGKLLRVSEIEVSGKNAVRIGLEDLPAGMLIFKLQDAHGIRSKMLLKSE